MLERIKMYAVTQVGGFLANCYSYGIQSALSRVPFYLSRSLLRGEILERNRVEQSPNPNVNIPKIILTDLQVMLLANLLMDGLSTFARAQGIPLPNIATGAFNTALIGTLYRMANGKNPLSFEDILQDIFNGVGRSFYIGKSIELMMPLCGLGAKDKVSAAVLTGAGVAGEYFLHHYKKAYAHDRALIEREAKGQSGPLLTERIASRL